ncbi:MAG: chemotaxis protein CheW [Alphaproteobacteria bacterium CG_4_10_14_0_8_um_filter_53_9]|nr:MAG: chemotaxis protein CheW [Alphaproteobacteria bacterium CG_4_10_14_0_8_um_filter_53_9]
MQLQQSASKNKEALTTMLQLVTFELFEETFALPILDVREIIRMTDITPVPQAPDFVEGVINLRGQIIPVVDLRKRFGLSPAELSDDSRVIVVELNSHMAIGLIVDAVREVERLPADTIVPPPALVAGSIGSEYIKGISNHEDKMIIHIDMRKVFSVEELEVLEGGVAAE